MWQLAGTTTLMKKAVILAWAGLSAATYVGVDSILSELLEATLRGPDIVSGVIAGQIVAAVAFPVRAWLRHRARGVAPRDVLTRGSRGLQG